VTDDRTAAATTTDDGPIVTATTDQIRKALLRYRVLAWITGIWLLILVAEMIAKYGFDVTGLEWIGPIHGIIYFVYLICTIDLATRIRWSVSTTVLTALAGTIPFLSFWVEHVRTVQVKTRFDL